MRPIIAFINRVLIRLTPRATHVRLSLIVSLLVQLTPLQTVRAAFDDLGVGGRGPGMADAFVAVADDASGTFYNPAGLVQMVDGEIGTQYGQVLRGLDDGSNLGTTYLGFAQPLRRGYSAFGAAYHNFKADNLFNERTIVLSYGQRLNIEPFGWKGIWSGGVNFKQLHHQFEPDRFSENALNDAGVSTGQSDPLFGSGAAKAAYAMDLGSLYQFGQGYQYTAGVALTNINRPDVSLSGSGDKVPFAAKAGLAYRPRWGTLSAEARRVKRLETITDSELALGIERNIPTSSIGALVLRGGYAEGSRGFKTLTAGLGYIYSRIRLDYVFNFPISSLTDTQGSHRIAFALKMGNGGEMDTVRDYADVNLLAAFSSDSLTSHILITRFGLYQRMTPAEKDQLLLLLMRKYPLDDPGLKNISATLRDLIRRKTAETMDWSLLKYEFLRGIAETEKPNAAAALELLAKGESKSALARIALLPENVKRSRAMSVVSLIALGETAAETYRSEELDKCIDQMRQLVDLMPSDQVVMRAYRLLLMERTKKDNMVPVIEDSLSVSEELPQADPNLVAPQPEGKTQGEPTLSEKDILAKNYATALGYYFMRKSANAKPEELTALLNQMKAVYGSTGMDISLVEKELAVLKQKPEIVPAPEKPKEKEPSVEPDKSKAAPTAKPSPKTKPVKAVVPTAIPAPVSVSNPELERAWDYYKKAVDRNISDHEKIELLEAMLVKFGEKGAAKINKELQRIRKRVDQQ